MTNTLAVEKYDRAVIEQIATTKRVENIKNSAYTSSYNYVLDLVEILIKINRGIKLLFVFCIDFDVSKRLPYGTVYVNPFVDIRQRALRLDLSQHFATQPLYTTHDSIYE
ncbi:hypothetical protein Tcan_03044 [Toxocara canis]|uniref:Uncharacterized protein n=1 Tax=Toxocara canis TaxID=6265 RepID=A0A0B2VSX9_TOXCA|nr:hypothetical protein Tcan_03044 [Toxocara canis]